MKNKYSFLFLFFLLISFTSCKESFDDLSSEVIQDGEQDVEMLLATPVTYSSSLSGTDYENRIDQLDLLICKNGEYLYSRQAYASQLTGAFRSTLKIDNGITIYFFANCRDILEENGDLLREREEGEPKISWNEIRKKLIDNNPSTLINNQRALPMWGETNADISDRNVNDLGKIILVRSAASVDLTVNVPKEDFELLEVYIYNTPNKGKLAPEPDVLENLVALSPDCPLDMQTSLRLELHETAIVNNNVEGLIYLYDNDASQTPVNRKYTRVVVGGKYKRSGKITYYPLDIQNNNTLLQIIRNHKYQINVISVNDQGWNTPDEAANAAGVNIDYQVVDWSNNTDTNIFMDGPKWVSMKSREALLARSEGFKTVISLTTNFEPEDFILELNEPHYGPSKPLEEGIGVENSRFSVELIVKDGKVSQLLFTSLQTYQDYDTFGNRDYLDVTVGRIKFDIEIEQLDKDGDDWGSGGGNEVDV